jgi:hypothetical protein
VLAIKSKGTAKAYPIRMLGYHFLVNDVLGNVPVLATYSTLSHAGRVWSRNVGGLILNFHLAGNNNQNFLMQDDVTGSWWQQSTGMAIYGRLLGHQLDQIPWDELTISQWRAEEPVGTVLAGDPQLTGSYLRPDWESGKPDVPALDFDDDSLLEPRNLIFGVRIKDDPRAFQAPGLLREKMAIERLGGVVVLLAVAPDGESVRAWQLPADTPGYSKISGTTDPLGPIVMDENGGRWNFRGCNEAGACMERLQVTREYWFDWRSFNADTTISPIR